MAKKTSPAAQIAEKVVSEAKEASVGMSELAAALVAAINATKPPTKKTPNSRIPNTPWTTKDGTPKPKLKRKMTQHGLILDPDMLTSKQIDLLNRLRPGVFLEGHVLVKRRRDRGIDIDYPMKTAAQRLKLVNAFGIRDLDELLARCIDEAANPKVYILPDDIDY